MLLHDVPWATYVVLRDTVDSRAVHMTYLEGRLEIMVKSKLHEVSTKQIARFLELFCLELDIPLYGYRETTWRSEEASRGLEADECYCRGADRELPDFAIEVIAGAPLLDKLEVYRGLGIREVWTYLATESAFRIFALHDGRYAEIDRSEVLPELDVARLIPFLQHEDQHVALKTFRDELRR